MGSIWALADVLVVILAFGMIVFVHELGHFIAARWAGIRVLAFAMGFGPALVSYRRGLGWRRGSSETEYIKQLNAEASGATTVEGSGKTPHRMSPTEYRLNVIPFGGYVKMLGQDDVDPRRTSSAPDSYQSCKPWKRMVVISAGVVMNIILAAFLFMIVFKVGITSEAASVGLVLPGSPAANAEPLTPGTDVGLRAGDRFVSIDGNRMVKFNDVIVAGAMSARHHPLTVVVDRGGSELSFRVRPEVGERSGLQELGVSPGFSDALISGESVGDSEFVRVALRRAGLEGVEPGSRLATVAGQDGGIYDLLRLLDASPSRPVELGFTSPGGAGQGVTYTPRPELQIGLAPLGAEGEVAVEHVHGLTPVLTVDNPSSDTAKHLLRPGDIFVRIEQLEFPSIIEGIREIRRHAGKSVSVTVRRAGDDGGPTSIELELPVSRKGQVGFSAGDTSGSGTLLARTPAGLHWADDEGGPVTPVPGVTAGCELAAVDGTPVSTLTDVRRVIAQHVADQASQGVGAQVELTYRLPVRAADGSAIEQTTLWTLSEADTARAAGLEWSRPLALFEFEQTELKADGPIGALVMGVRETHSVMMMTYVTFLRLFEGTVKVQHLKGPVGIVHIGARIADRGLIWLMFFAAIISVNLAVINFLPLPVVDGGQFVFILIEQIRGRPVSPNIQAAATFAGLVLIATMFLIVTFNDLMNLLGG